MIICVYGSASDRIDQKYKTAAYALGKEMARRGHDLVYGGGALGVMGAVARGVKDGGGRVIGVLPEFFKETHAEQLNYDCDELIWCQTMHERKSIMEEKASAFVIAPGGIGTFDEFFSVLTQKQLGRHDKPITLFNVAGVYDGFNAVFANAYKERFINGECAAMLRSFTDVAALLDYIESDEPYSYNKTNLKDG